LSTNNRENTPLSSIIFVFSPFIRNENFQMKYKVSNETKNDVPRPLASTSEMYSFSENTIPLAQEHFF
jgi:hypothetical protein